MVDGVPLAHSDELRRVTALMKNVGGTNRTSASEGDPEKQTNLLGPKLLFAMGSVKLGN